MEVEDLRALNNYQKGCCSQVGVSLFPQVKKKSGKTRGNGFEFNGGGGWGLDWLLGKKNFSMERFIKH